MELGFDIDIITPYNFDRNLLVNSDFVIINNFYLFSAPLYHFILKVLWEYKKPYMVYFHDHRDILEGTNRIRFARNLFQHSFLNVFISPMHMTNFRKELGDVIDPHFILTPPIDTDFFKPIDTIKRKKKTVVNLTGRLVSSKGLMNIVKWSMVNNDYEVSVYTDLAVGNKGRTGAKILREIKNIKVFDKVPYKKLPEIYSRHEYVVHFPQALEAAGRTLVEGALCGCKVLFNDKVGVGSFSQEELPLENQSLLRKVIKSGPYRFWAEIVRSMAWN